MSKQVLSCSLFLLCLCFHLICLAQIEVLADDRFVFSKDGTDIALPYYSTENIHQFNDRISKIIVVVHGTNRNADDYFDNMKTALRQRPAMIDQTLIIAPQFLREDDIEAFRPGHEFPYWSSDGWKVGATSKDEDPHPRDLRISSYEVLDSLLLHLVNTFKEVTELIFTGHSAGGQLTNRYTASSPIFAQLCDNYGISSKSIIANPGSYVYFSPKRRVAGTLDQFEVPDSCDEYNDYSYGLEDLYIYHSRSGDQQMKDWYETREVVYLFGANDNDPNASTLPSSCRAKLQGDHRLEKGMIYFNHLIDFYGEQIKQTQRMIIVPDVGHNNFEIYNSEEGISELFDIPSLNSCSTTTAIKDIDVRSFSAYPNPSSNYLFIKTDELSKKSGTLTIYNSIGKNVLRKKLTTPTTRIDIQHLKRGSYFLHLQDEESVLTHKFFKE